LEVASEMGQDRPPGLRLASLRPSHTGRDLSAFFGAWEKGGIPYESYDMMLFDPPPFSHIRHKHSHFCEYPLRQRCDGKGFA
jgi:hypothetical protein